jgi:hypothetical protein
MPGPTKFNALDTKTLTVNGATVFSNVVNATITFDPPAIATLTGADSSAITVTGAALGDRVLLFPPYDTAGLIIYGRVSAANQIKITMYNPTGASIDLASGSWKVKVLRP